MRLLIGNFKGKQGDQGKEGPKGDTGSTGPRGSRWTSGTAVTGTDTTGVIFPGSNIADARLYDYYVNTDTGNLYECTVEGAADVAEWVHIGNIKGPAGDTGPEGSISNINDQKPTYEEAKEIGILTSGETVGTAFGKLKKAVSVLMSHYMQKATASILGHVRLSDSAAITTAGEYALDAVEKNASVPGTLANLIAQQNSNLSNMMAIKTSTNVDANAIEKMGIYETNNHWIHLVGSHSYYGVLIVYKVSTWIFQEWRPTDSNAAYIRRNINNAGWTEWTALV